MTKVKYIDSRAIPISDGGTGHVPTNITLGKEYELLNTYKSEDYKGKDGEDMFTIINDKGKKVNYRASRFLVANLSNKIVVKGGSRFIREAFLTELVLTCDFSIKHDNTITADNVGVFTLVADNYFKNCFYGNCGDLGSPTFNLPEDYNKALEAAKNLGTKILLHNIGTGDLTIEIHKDKIVSKYGFITIDELKELYERASQLINFEFKSLTSNLNHHVVKNNIQPNQKIIKIGSCDNNLFSFEEIKMVYDTWNKIK